jgi:hypothetical protein
MGRGAHEGCRYSRDEDFTTTKVGRKHQATPLCRTSSKVMAFRNVRNGALADSPRVAGATKELIQRLATDYNPPVDRSEPEDRIRPSANYAIGPVIAGRP